MCSLITSTFVLERDNEFLTLQIAPDYHAVQRIERRASRRVSIQGFKRSNLQKKKSEIPSFTHLLTQLFKTSLEGREGRRCEAHSPADQDSALSKATKQERRRYKRTVNTHKTRITRPRREPRLGVFNQRHERAGKKERK